jgi:predicted anti-sigma-YlaC factor YlaD
MSEHDKIRKLLALAAAGAVSSTEKERVALHLHSCEACSGEMDCWQSIASDLRRLPTPQPSRALFERTRLRAEQKLAEEAEYRWQRGVMVFVVVFAWVLTIASWPVVRLVTGGLLSLLDPQLNRSWISFAGFTALVWLAGGTAAVLLSLRQRRERRMA